MKTKEEKIKYFNPNGLATGSNLFGLPFDEKESDIIVLPVPWEVTVSFNTGTSRAPEAVMEASKQVDLFDADVGEAWKRGIFMKKSDKVILKQSKSLRKKAEKYLKLYEAGASGINEAINMRNEINAAGKSLKNWVKQKMLAVISKQKLPVLLGGDHSTPLGFIEALSQHHPSFGILQIDAHCDLRNTYEGFEFSHASIMFNALKISQVQKLVQVGARDYCHEEMDVIHHSNGRVKAFFDADMKRKMIEETSWKIICDSIVSELPGEVYISFDIDGLDPKLCPHTGTPVPGGLEYEQAVYLIKNVVDSGRLIIGADLNEICPAKDGWDANVGARLLYKLCNLMGKSNEGKKQS
ncbi:MAG: agmatinase family protein [Chitinophagales bacterium]